MELRDSFFIGIKVHVCIQAAMVLRDSFFMLLSFLGGGIGNNGQSNYAAGMDLDGRHPLVGTVSKS
jgi:hypothetical protein